MGRDNRGRNGILGARWAKEESYRQREQTANRSESRDQERRDKG